MTDISKINPNGTEYNLKDATARNAIQSSKTLKSSVVTVTDAAPINAEDITVDITPVQDLHGYDRPWAGGAWKNKLPMTVDGIKAANTSGTWSGNVYTKNDITYTLQTDDGGNITGIKVSGTASAESSLNIVTNFDNVLTVGTSYILNGCPSGGSDNTYLIFLRYSGSDVGSGLSFVYGGISGTHLSIIVKSGVSISNKVFYPMIRLATETDPTFAPYSNICPIEGWTGAELDRVGKNWLPESQTASFSVNGVTVANNNDGTYTTSNSASAYGVCKVLEGKSIPRGSYILSGGFATTDGVSVMLTPKNNDSVNIARSYGGDVAFTLDEDTEIDMYFTFRTHYPYAPTTISPMIRLASITDSTYEPYQGEQYTASFGETVYGGKWHVTEGGTDKTYANIASYNGETINEPWLSSMDEYVAGATPTTGAQVVYPLTTPTAISTPKQNVPMLQGINTVYADCGDTQLKYQPDNVVGELKGEIRAVEAELAEAEANLEIVYEDHVANTSMGIIVDGYSVGDMPFSNALDIAKTGYTPIAVTDTSIVHSTVATQGEIATHCLLDVANNRVRFYVHVMDSAASLTIPPNSLTFRVAYKKA